LPGQLEKHLIPAVTEAGFPQDKLPALVSAVGIGSVTQIAQIAGNDQTLIKVINDGAADSFAGAYAYVFYAAMALGIVAAIASIFLRDMDQYLTSHVARQIYHKKDTDKDILDLKKEEEMAHHESA
jgi:hypothetical protein